MLSAGPTLFTSRGLRLLVVAVIITLFSRTPAPAWGEQLWSNRYQMRPTDVESTFQPPPILLGCRFRSCFPGFSQQTLRLETSAHGPFLKQWVLGLSSLPIAERSGITLAGDAQNADPVAVPVSIQLGRVGVVSGLQPEHGESLPRMSVTVELDLVALRRWKSGEGPPLTEVPQLVLEARQVVSGIEVHHWQYIYDFSALAPPMTVRPILDGQDQVVLPKYLPASSPIVMVARGNDLGSRLTNVFVDQLALDIENMTESTRNVEIAVWARDNQPILDLKPTLTEGPDTIPEIAIGLLKLTPNLRLPPGKPAPDVAPNVKWEDLAHCEYAVANRLFLNNRVGVVLQFEALAAGDVTQCEGESILRQRPEFDKGRLNLFYVAEDNKPQNCCLQKVPEAMFITLRATPTSLAHELGHSFGLMDDEASGNIMLGGALDRNDFTLPQVYLMVFGAESTLNSLNLRVAPTRNAGECPSQCKGGASAIFLPQCVKPNASFSDVGSPPTRDEVHTLLMRLDSEESIPVEAPFLKDGPLARDPALVPFLKAVALRGVRYDPVVETLRAIRARLGDEECPIAADTYVKLYSGRIVANSQRAAANALFALGTLQAKEALKAIRQTLSGSLREHIENLLLNWPP